MRSMHLAQNGVQPPPGFAPHTPNMSMDALSPATLGQGIGVGQSPRITTGRAMTRDVSKSGSMLPPQSPATGVRASTPKATLLKTPKLKEEHLVSCYRLPRTRSALISQSHPTPKSVQPSPSMSNIPVPPEQASNQPISVITPSPPGASASNPTTGQSADQTMSTAPTSVPSLSNDSNALSFGSTDLMSDSGMFDGDFDFGTLVNDTSLNFDFGQYLAEIGDDNGDGGDGGDMGLA